jgi:hypothetical protein
MMMMMMVMMIMMIMMMMMISCCYVQDADVSIRQRALELIYQLVNDQNVVSLTAEMLNYLVVAGTAAEQKANLAAKIMQIVEKVMMMVIW